MNLLLYPVIDLKRGLVVHGVRGARSSYRPIESRLVRSAEPLNVARAFRDALGLERLYLADLDALEGAPRAAEVIQSLCQDGFRLLVDAGLRSREDALSLLDLGVEEIIAPLETLPDPSALEDIVEAAGTERAVFSLDLKGGALMGNESGWPHANAESVAREARRRGARKMLFLDLAFVGSRGGPAHLELLRHLALELPDVQLLSGGGIRSYGDLILLEKAGLRGALAATAFHDGAITRDDLLGKRR